MLRSIASCEDRSGYILAQHLNYDPTVNAQELLIYVREINDHETMEPFRRYARLRLPSVEYRNGTDEYTIPSKGAVILYFA